MVGAIGGKNQRRDVWQDRWNFLPYMEIPIIHRADNHEWDATTIDALSNEIGSMPDTEINRLGRWGTVAQALLIS